MNGAEHTVIYTHGGGRLGNQVLRFLHWMAWARANREKIEILNFAFWPFAPYFALWSKHPGCVFPLRDGPPDRWARRFARQPRWLRKLGENRNRLPRFVQWMGSVVPGWQALEIDDVAEESLDLDDPLFLQRVIRRPVTTCSGWKIATWKRVAEQESALREYFQLVPDVAARTAAFVSELRREYTVVIGVFIRHTDYKVWYDGRFFFSAALYAGWMRQILDLHGGQRVGFVIASDVWHDPAQFDGLPVRFATGTPNGGGLWIESWGELSLCDVVVSPPSTFSATAAFLGNVPLWPVVSPEQKMAAAQVLPNSLVAAAKHPSFSCSVK